MQKSKLIHAILRLKKKNIGLSYFYKTLFKSVFNKDKNNYHYKIFLEKCLYQLPKNNNNK